MPEDTTQCLHLVSCTLAIKAQCLRMRRNVCTYLPDKYYGDAMSLGLDAMSAPKSIKAQCLLDWTQCPHQNTVETQAQCLERLKIDQIT